MNAHSEDTASIFADFRPCPDLSEARLVSERLRDAVRSEGGNQVVAARSGVPLSSLNTYVAGREMKTSVLSRLADACGVTVEWLATGRPPRRRPQAGHGLELEPSSGGPELQELHRDEKSRYVMIPRFNIMVSAGPGAHVGLEQAVETFAFERAWIANRLRRPADRLVLVKARGDSMEPTISDRDILLVDMSTDQTLVDGGIYVLRTGDNLLVKRLSPKVNGDLVISSDNPHYGPEVIEGGAWRTRWDQRNSEVTFIGRVVWRSGIIA